LPPLLLLSAAAAASLEKESMQPEAVINLPLYARSDGWHAAATYFLVGQVDLMISASGAKGTP
jgi:hypothetical protein